MQIKTVIIAIVIIIGLVVISYTLRHDIVQTELPNSEHLYHSIDSLNELINNMQIRIDSLQYKIDTSKITIINIHKDYEKQYLNLSNAPLGKQLDFFSEYLSKGN